MKMRNNPGTEKIAQTASFTDEAAPADPKGVTFGQPLKCSQQSKRFRRRPIAQPLACGL
jgi:hypothetical protein